ncbi:MAG: hypothetical protein A3E01_09185 [Gammaproteobacteria bacterium RIFCSPHIGHO2_12_FULL_63_22]|nr:MAG: hypothetical protein A3E01_09185 [Gammaproteobacteria bacterium RIFCSPHIGHO2_12_FULL_63_22]
MSTPTRVVVNNARGESFADVARRIGAIGDITIPSTYSDAEVMAALSSNFAEIVAAAGYTVIDAVETGTSALNSDGNITLTGEQTIAGVMTSTSRVLLMDQTAPAENGIYVTAAGAWARATDFDQTAEVVQGSYVPVTGGDNAGAWVLTTADPITVGTTAQTWRMWNLNQTLQLISDLASTASGEGASLIGIDLSVAQTSETVGAILWNWADVTAAPWLADRTGAADSTTAFNDALATGRPVKVPSGTFKISSLTALDRDGVVIDGAGPDLTIIQQTSTTADLFTIGAGVTLRYSPSISNMSFTVASTKTAGYLVKASKTFGLKVSNVRCDGYFGLVDLVTCQWTTIRDSHCVNMVATNGKAVSARSGGSNLIIQNLSVDGGVGTQCYAGLYVEEWDGVFMSAGTQFNRCGNALVIAPPAATNFDHMFVSGASFDTCSGVGILFKNSGGNIRRLVFSAGWNGSHSNSGVEIEAGASVTGLTFDSWRTVNCGSYGFNFQEPVDGFSYTDGIISGNSTSSSGTYSGIFFANGGTYNDMNLSNTRITPLEGFSNSQKYAIEVEAATGPVFADSTIVDCNLSGNVTGAISWASANPRTIFMRNNTGYITEAQGSATLLNGTTSIAVNHGLSLTPIAGEIMVTPLDDLGTASKFRVPTADYTSSQFTIRVNADPGANVGFAWQAVVA